MPNFPKDNTEIGRDVDSVDRGMLLLGRNRQGKTAPVAIDNDESLIVKSSAFVTMIERLTAMNQELVSIRQELARMNSNKR